ncbi:hypothetical protein RHMOL_Rhmol12G0240700 [Rhododendron molle]|uniref:Uncharacterized protein n=1 Tax=Rhododendron molle TaxID=49168 RepID=A0ACC0LN08_RHOML|nr:hypothetical protein RHMOL_Rhmol12G0240700 [Rhododendron molle]
MAIPQREIRPQLRRLLPAQTKLHCNSCQQLQALLRRGPLGVDRDGDDSQGLLPAATASDCEAEKGSPSEKRGSSLLEEYLTVEEARAKGYKSGVAAKLPVAADSL